MVFNNSTAHLVMPDELSAIIQDYARPLFCPTKEHRALMRKVVNEFGRLHLQVCLSLKYQLQDFLESHSVRTNSYRWAFLTSHLYFALENGVPPIYRGKRSVFDNECLKMLFSVWEYDFEMGGCLFHNDIDNRVINECRLSHIRFDTLRLMRSL